MKILITGGSGFIGTNMVEYFQLKNFDVLNIDIAPPQNDNHRKFWMQADILDKEKLEAVVADFNPDYAVHLAARTDLDGVDLEAYSSNTAGVENIVSALCKASAVKRVIFASTQLVCARRNPDGTNDYETINLYGESKKIGELFLRSFKDLPFEYVIVRPTSIWGPWFGIPYNKFFKMVLAGHYFNIGKKSATKTFGFVGNLLYQIEALLFSEYDKVSGKVFYLGDRPASPIKEWADEIGKECGKKIVTVPYFVFKMAAYFGDFLKLFKINFPMTSYRLTNMTTSFENDLSEIYNIAPEPPYSRLEGTKITLKWMREHK